MQKLRLALAAAVMAVAAFTAHGQRAPAVNEIGDQMMEIEWVAQGAQRFGTRDGQIVHLVGRAAVLAGEERLSKRVARRLLAPGQAVRVVVGRRGADNEILVEKLAIVPR